MPAHSDKDERRYCYITATSYAAAAAMLIGCRHADMAQIVISERSKSAFRFDVMPCTLLRYRFSFRYAADGVAASRLPPDITPASERATLITPVRMLRQIIRRFSFDFSAAFASAATLAAGYAVFRQLFDICQRHIDYTA